jgi:HlyD family type I secretion membrane fusion protein
MMASLIPDTAPARPRKEQTYLLGGRVMLGAAAGLALILGLGGWGATAQLAGAVLATGSVVVDENLKSVQHRDGGIIADILVREGASVTAGQVLIRLDDAATSAELSILRHQMMELAIRRARLMAERDQADSITFPQASDDASETIAGEERIFTGNRQHRQSRKQQLRLTIGQIGDEITGLLAQRAAKDHEITLVTAEQARMQALADQNLLEQARIYAINRDVARLTGEYGEITASIARARSKINEIELQILQIDDAARTEAQRELSQVDARLAELRDRHAAVADRLTRTDIRAPSDGIVNEIAVHTIGGVVSPAEVLVTIVPDNAPLRIEAQIPPTSIDQIHPGQDARLRFSAFNHRTTPEIPGTVSHIAAAPTRDPVTGMPHYIALIDLLPEAEAMLDGLALLPGMPVEVFVTTEYRTAIDYLLQPITDQFQRAMRER